MKVQYRRNRVQQHYPLKIFLLALAFIVLVLLGSLVYVLFKVNLPNNREAQSVEFEIESGESLKSLSGRLREENIISSSFIFRLYARLENSASKVQAGSFALSASMDMKEILDTVTGQGKSDEVRLTFPEGILGAAIGERLAQAGVVDPQNFAEVFAEPFRFASFDFLNEIPASGTLEGFLFPDTYDFDIDAEADDTIRRMLANFENKLTPQVRRDIAAQGRTIFEVVTLASIIEAEVGRPTGIASEIVSEERRLVAGVFMNRLAINHPLQSDATLAYSTGERKRQLTAADLEIDDLYNTYFYRGLPPGPINNPSLDAILASVYPADTDYFYFLSKPDGEAVFARTLEEHNTNKNRYLR